MSSSSEPQIAGDGEMSLASGEMFKTLMVNQKDLMDNQALLMVCQQFMAWEMFDIKKVHRQHY